MATQLPAHLQQKIDEYEHLLEATEYSAVDAHKSDLRQIKLGQFAELTRDMMTPMAPGALKLLWDIANGANGASAAVQAKCAMYILDRVIGKEAIDSVDPLQKLVQQLKGQQVAS